MIELHEIEDHEVTQQALEEREAKLLEAQEVAQLGFYELDLRTRRWTSSETLERIVNIPDDYPRTIEGWAALIHPDDRQAVMDYLHHEIIGRGEPCDREYRIVRYGSDEVRWVHGLGRVRFDASGRPAVLFGTVQDVTDRKVAEIALQQAHDELELRVQERTAELGLANGELGRANAQLQREMEQQQQRHEERLREHRSLEHMLRASDHERQLIAYDIHDGLAQEVAGALMQFQVFDQLNASKPDEAKKAFDGGLLLLRRAHAEARRLISGVRPPILDESGVVAAIAHLVHDPAFEGGPKLRFRSNVAFRRLAPALENVVYRIVQEGLTNARHHSKSDAIVVSLLQRRDWLRIEIRDRGIGFNPQTVQENRFGIAGMRERARLLGGKCRIRSKPGAGASVVVLLPLGEPGATGL